MNFKLFKIKTIECILISLLISILLTKCESKGSLIILNEENWDQMLSEEWMVEFFAPWCPACRALTHEWNTFSTWSSDLSIKVGSVDVTANPGLSGRFMVTALPTIYHVKDGVFRQYKGSRDSNAFVSFIEEKKWQSIDPVSNWKSPDSFQMSIVSYFFKISMALRSVHNRLVEDYGIPYWGSYILFAFATIILGAILGLLIVCVIDLIFPAKMTTEDSKDNQIRDVSETNANSDNSDLNDDDINDINDINDIHSDEKEESSDDTNTEGNNELRRRKKSINSQDEED